MKFHKDHLYPNALSPCVLCEAGFPIKNRKSLPAFNLDNVEVPPRHGKYNTKRLRKKWTKLHGKKTKYKGCSIVSYKED